MSWQDNAMTYLKDTSLNHHYFTQVTDDAMALLSAAKEGEMVAITGSTRVGKSHASEYIPLQLYGELQPDADMRPYSIVTAENSSTAGAFSTRSFAREALFATRHPMYSNPELEKTFSTFRFSHSRITEDEMRSDLISALQNRGAKLLVIDEIQNIAFVNGGIDRAKWYLDSLKCVAAKAKVVILFLGTYEYLPIRDRCEQLVGRSDTIIFPRYKCETVEETCIWEQILETYSECLSFAKPSESLRDYSEYLHQYTFGCFGLLNKWLRSAVAFSKIPKSPYLTQAHLDRAKKDVKEREAVWNSIRFGEEYLSDPDSVDVDKHFKQSAKNKTGAVKSKEKKRGRPGIRNPRRHTDTDRMEGTA